MAKNIKELFAKLNPILKEVYEEDVKPEVQNITESHIRNDVYSVYQPTQYERRYGEDGGFLNNENIIQKIENINTNTFKCTLENIATNKEGNLRLDKVIEYGEDYDWYSSNLYRTKNPYPRPFMQNIYMELLDYRIIQNVMKKGLNKRLNSKGIKIIVK